MIGKLVLLAAAALGVALAMAVYWNATTICADCRATTFDLDNILRLLGEEGAVAGGIFFLGSLFGLFLGRSLKDSENG